MRFRAILAAGAFDASVLAGAAGANAGVLVFSDGGRATLSYRGYTQ